MPNVIIIDYYDNSMLKQNIMIYNNFEILNKSIVELFNKQNKGFYNNFSEIIIIKENKLIINFKKSNDSNDQFTSLIGSLKNNIFESEYLLIYNDEEERKQHINNICNNLNDYINKLNFYENSAPLTTDDYRILGVFIKLNSRFKNDNYNRDNKMKVEKKEEDNIYKPKINNNIIKEYNKENKENKIHPNKIKLRDIYPFPPLIGLENIGATCYMNATLQCFCHIEKFVCYFKYGEYINTISINNKNNLTSSFKTLID